jgi:ankyrin repeat protein
MVGLTALVTVGIGVLVLSLDSPPDLFRWIERPSGEIPAETGDRTVLDTGQIVQGDVQVLDFEQVRASGGVEAALEVAIEKYPGELRRLLDEGVDPDLPLSHGDGEGWTHPLEKAARQGTPETFRILLDAGAEVDGRSSDGDTALHAAARQGQLGMVEELLRRGAAPDRLALPHDHAVMEARMRELGQQWEPPVGAAPVETAAQHGHRDVTARLLEAGAALRYALHAAAYGGSLELVELLLERGADPRANTAYGDGPLRHPAAKGHLEVVRRLLAAGARPGEQALREAASNGRDDVLRVFADSGVRFDVPPAYWDPLYSAAYAGRASTVSLLLELGASTAAAEGQKRPVDAAREQGHAGVVALLEGR